MKGDIREVTEGKLRKENSNTIISHKDLLSQFWTYSSSGHTLHSLVWIIAINFQLVPFPSNLPFLIHFAHAAKVIFLRQKPDDPVIPLLKILHQHSHRSYE